MKIKVLLVVISVAILLMGCANDTQQEGQAEVDSSVEQEKVENPDNEGNIEVVTKDSLGEFSSVTITGEQITQDIFADYDLTMVNIWASWCGPCVNEMGELAELYLQLPENVNLITMCEDAETQGELVEQILTTNKAEFHTIVVNDAMRRSIINRCSGFPTTVYIDKEGYIVGQAMVGAPSQDVIETYMNQIEMRLN